MIRFLGLLIFILSSCGYTKNIATKDVAKAQAIYPEVVAEACSNYYPPLDSISTTTKYIPGKAVLVPSPVKYVNCDSIVKGNAPDKDRVSVECPPSSNTTDTIQIEVYKTLVDKAIEKHLQKRLDISNMIICSLSVVLFISLLFNLFQKLAAKKDGK